MDFNVDAAYYRPRKIEILEGFKLIWYKVILRAIYDFALYKDSKNKSLKRLASSAEKWIFHTVLEKTLIKEGNKKRFVYVFPFNSVENLCVLLDLDVEDIRKFANKITRKDIRKIEFFQRSKYKPRKKKNASI